MSWLIVLAITAQQSAASDWLPQTNLVSAAKSRERMIECGIAATKVRVRDDNELQEQVVQVARDAEVSHSMMACIAQASLETSNYVEFVDPSVEARYAPIYAARAKLRGVEDARAALKRHGLLDRLPRFDGNVAGLTGYAGRLEALCGADPGALLTLASPTLLTIKPEALRATINGHPPVTDDQFICISDAVTASNLDDHGFNFGFIGNEAFSPPKDSANPTDKRSSLTAKPSE